MNYLLRTLLIFTLLAGISWAQNQDDQSEGSNAYFHESKSAMEEVLEDPMVKPVYEECQNGIKNKTITDSIDDCIWGKLDKSKQKEVYEKYFAKEEERDKPQYESLAVSNIKQNQDPAMAKVQAFFLKKLKEAMYGEIKDQAKQQQRVIDHKVFFELYESQVGKNIIGAMTSYCIETDLSSGKFEIPKDQADRDKNREKNLKLLSETTTAPPPQGSQGQGQQGQPTETNKAYALWAECIQKIKDVCYKSSSTKYSKERACQVTAYIKGARQNLLTLSSMKEDMKTLQGRGLAVTEYDKQGDDKAQAIQRGLYTGGRTGNNKQDSINDLTNVSSNEFVNASGFKEESEAQAKKLKEQCKSDKIDTPECKQYLMGKDEGKDADKLADEYALRTKFQEEKLKDMKKEDVAKYLKEEGYSDKDIEAKLKDQASIDEIKKQIQDRYKNERESVIASLRDQISGHTQEEDPQDPKANETKIETIAKDLESRPERYKQLIHFNNIVSGYLEVQTGEGKDAQRSKNTAALFHELDDSAYSDNNAGRDVASGQGQGQQPGSNVDEIKKAVDQTGLQPGENESGTINLGVNDINKSLLQYNDSNQGSGTGTTSQGNGP